MCPDVEEGVVLGLESNLAEFFVGEALESGLMGEVETGADSQSSAGHRSAASPGRGKQ